MIESSRYVVIGTPTLDGMVTVEYLRSLVGTVQLLTANGIHSEVSLQVGDSFIQKARNAIMKRFMEGPGTDVFFIDSDQGWEPEAVLRMLERPEAVVAGIPPRKQDQVSFPVIFHDKLYEGREGQFGHGLFLAHTVGAAFLRLKRAVPALIQALNPTNTYRNPEPGADPNDIYYAFFEAGVVNGEFWGEDYWFCHKVRSAGYQIWVDPNIMFSHTGRKQWSGNLGHYLTRIMDDALPGHGTDGEEPAAGDRAKDAQGSMQSALPGNGSGHPLEADHGLA
jgi:hypothetical protein